VRRSPMSVERLDGRFALYAGVLAPEILPLNIARFVFLDPRAPEFFVQWTASPTTSHRRSASKQERTPRCRA
jgi:hypothetical protein